MNDRYLALEKAWDEISQRIANAAAKSGRSEAEITAIPVTKTFPPSDVNHLTGLGFRQFGENRVAELQEKARLDYDAPVTWHMVGQLQTNKVNHAVRAAQAIHSCDRLRLVNALERAAQNQEKRLQILLQVRLDSDPNRGGVEPGEIMPLAEAVANTTSLDLQGVMAMAPQGVDPRPAFDRLRQVSEEVRATYPLADWISAGMSEDFEFAIECGATHVRLGRGLLGSRPYLG